MSKLLTNGYIYHKLRKPFGNVLDTFMKCQNLLQNRFKNMFQRESPGLLWRSSVQSKEGQVAMDFYFIGFENSN